MKRPYQKPVLGVESFQLNAAIALSCSAQDYTPIRWYEDECSFEGQFFNLFNCVVDISGPQLDGNDAICYHGPFASYGQIFVYS